MTSSTLVKKLSIVSTCLLAAACSHVPAGTDVAARDVKIQVITTAYAISAPQKGATPTATRKNACVGAYLIGLRNIAEMIGNAITIKGAKPAPIATISNMEQFKIGVSDSANTQKLTAAGVFGQIRLNSETIVENSVLKADIIKGSYKNEQLLVKNSELESVIPEDISGILEENGLSRRLTGVDIKKIGFDDKGNVCTISLAFMPENVKINQEEFEKFILNNLAKKSETVISIIGQ